MSGVTVVHEGDLVAVLHADPELAAAALAQVKAEWTPAPPGADQDGIFDELLAKAPAAIGEGRQGRPRDGARAAARRFEHTYQKGYVAHAPIEPHAATAVDRERQAHGLGLDADAVPACTTASRRCSASTRRTSA